VRPTIIISSLLTAALLAAGCGSEDKAGDTTQTSQQAGNDGKKQDSKQDEKQPKKARPKSNEPSAAAGAKSDFEGVYAATFTKKDGFRPGKWRLRFAGTTVEMVGHAIHERLGFVHQLLVDDPWSRKW